MRRISTFPLTGSSLGENLVIQESQ
jgi:hypothetical protein